MNTAVVRTTVNGPESCLKHRGKHVSLKKPWHCSTQIIIRYLWWRPIASARPPRFCRPHAPPGARRCMRSPTSLARGHASFWLRRPRLSSTTHYSKDITPKPLEVTTTLREIKYTQLKSCSSFKWTRVIWDHSKLMLAGHFDFLRFFCTSPSLHPFTSGKMCTDINFDWSPSILIKE